MNFDKLQKSTVKVRINLRLFLGKYEETSIKIVCFSGLNLFLRESGVLKGCG